MDMREASAMTEASGLVNDQGGIEQTSVATPRTRQFGPDSGETAPRLSDQLRKIAVKAPLSSLSTAFLLGFMLARRR